MEPPPFTQTSDGGETVEDPTHDEILRVAQCSTGAIAPQIDEVVG